MHEDTARDFLFAEECSLNACTQSDMQGSMDLFTKTCDDFSLKISTEKTEVLHQLVQAAPYTEPHITINGQRQAAVDKFVYLGGTLARSANIDEEVAYRIAKSQHCLWQTKGQCLGVQRTEP